MRIPIPLFSLLFATQLFAQTTPKPPPPEPSTAAVSPQTETEAPETTAPETTAPAPPETTGSTAPATAPAPKATKPAPASQPSSAPATAAAPKSGDIIDGHRILAITSQKRLFDGRPTREKCGYVQDVIVRQKLKPVLAKPPKTGPKAPSQPATKPFTTELKVTCVKQGGKLVPGTAFLVLPESTTQPSSLASSQANSQPAVFEPVATAKLTTPAKLLKGISKLGAPQGEDGKPIEGEVELQSSITRTGQIYSVMVIKGTHPLLDDMSLAAAKKFKWAPATVKKKKVDSIVIHSIDWKISVPESKMEKAPFYKGELSSLGSVHILNAKNSIGVALGGTLINNVYFAELRPELNLHFGDFSMGIGGPLRFEVFDVNAINLVDPNSYGDGFQNAGRFRTEDWDRILQPPYTDIVRPIRYLTYGRKEDNIYVDINRAHAITIGHGQLMRRYSPNVDIDESNLFSEFDAYHDFGGVELMLGPLPIPRLFGGLVFVKPLGLFSDDYRLKSLSLGVSYLRDNNTPTQLTTTENPLTGKQQYPVDEGRFVYDNRDRFSGYAVQGLGIDGEFKVLRWNFIDIKVYGDYSHLFFPGVPEQKIAEFHGGGATVGSLFRLSFGQQPVRPLDDETEDVRLGRAPRETKAVQAARIRLEARTFNPQYLPSYFNPYYEIDKYQFGLSSTKEGQRATLPTKAAYLATQEGEPWRAGYYLEASYALIDWFAVTAVYEDAYALGGDAVSVAAARNLVLHAETHGLGFLQLFATYHYHNFDFANWNQILQFGTDSEILYMGGRLQLLIFGFNLGLQRGYRISFLDDEGSDRPYEPNGKDYPHSSVGFRNQWHVNFDVEIGWQF